MSGSSFSSTSSLFTPLSFTPLTATTAPCTWSSSFSGPNVQYGVGSAIGLAFDAIAEANRNKEIAINTGLSSGNHFSLPQGTYHVGATRSTEGVEGGVKITKGNGYVRYNYPNGHFTVVGSDGSKSSGIGGGW
jgi:hypothetical protein